MFLQENLVGLAVIKPRRYQVRQHHRQDFGSQFRLNLAAIPREFHLQARPKFAVIDPQGIPYQHFGSSRIENDRRILTGIAFLHQASKLSIQKIAERKTTFKGSTPFARIAEHRKIRLDEHPGGGSIRIALHMQEFQGEIAKIPRFVGQGLIKAVIFAI